MDNNEPKTLKEIDDLKYRVPIDELKLGDNYKEVKRDSIDKLKRSLLDDDQLLPILTDARIERDGVIIGGYHQYFAIKELIEEGKWLHGNKVWVEPRTPKDDKHAKILALKHNTQYDIATTERLAEYGADLIDSEYMLSDIPVITDYQVLTLIDVMDKVGPEVEVTEDEAPEVDETVEPVSKLGRVYKLGRHRLMCGDSTKIEDVEKLMNGQKADISFTSPPYNVGETPNGNESKYVSSKDNKDLEEYTKFLVTTTENALVFAQYCFVNLQSVSGNKLSLIEYLYQLRHLFADYIVWDKMGAEPAMQSNVLNSRFEFIYVFSRKATRVIGTKEYRGTLENVVYINSRQEKQYADVHKATYPVEFASHFVKNFSNDSVLDLFGGTGTTLIACEQLDRTCYMMEIDPKYCDVIRKRYAKFIGKEDTWETETPIVSE